jgi:hypothetical protein
MQAGRQQDRQQGASSRAEEGLEERKKSSSMLVQAQAGEAQAARGFWAGPGRKSRKLLVQAGRQQDRQQGASSRAEEGLEERKISSSMLVQTQAGGEQLAECLWGS